MRGAGACRGAADVGAATAEARSRSSRSSASRSVLSSWVARKPCSGSAQVGQRNGAFGSVLRQSGQTEVSA